MSNEMQLVDQQGEALPLVQQKSYGTTPADLLVYAMQNGATIAEVREFMMLKREFDADEARKAFVADMAEFKKNPPEIVKDKLVAFSGTSYMHATIGNVTEAIVAGLAAHGFSHRWTIDQSGANITVTCVLTHKQGHSESTPMTAQKDDSGKKNQIQQIASTITYLQRYTLLAATGVATKDQSDDDGHAAELDTTLADNWIAKAQAAPTLKDLELVWASGVGAIQAVGDQRAYKEFKAAVSTRKAEFPAPPPVAKPTDEELDAQRTKGQP